MRFTKTFPQGLAALALILTLSAISFAKKADSKFANIKINNFGQMDERFYRGARPGKNDYQALAALGIKTVIDLTDNSRSYEQPAVEAAGLRYVNIALPDKSAPTTEQINAFLKLVNDPATGMESSHQVGIGNVTCIAQEQKIADRLTRIHRSIRAGSPLASRRQGCSSGLHRLQTLQLVGKEWPISHRYAARSCTPACRCSSCVTKGP